MPKPKVSIIIPVYNAEKSMRKAIDSILAQTERQLELILVDDGSEDGSGAVCDEYGARDRRVRVIHQANAGVSAARNAGIDAACGDYIGFVDGDDHIAPDMYGRLLQEAERTGADVVRCDAVTVYENGRTRADTISQLTENTLLQKSDLRSSLLPEMAGAVWRCLYRKTMLDAFGVRFPLGVKFSEDRVFNLYAFGNADKVAYIKEAYYYHQVNAQSAVHRFRWDCFEAYKLAAAAIEQAIKSAWDDDAPLQRAYLGQLIAGAEAAVCNYYYKTSPMKRTERMEALRRLCDDELLREAICRYGPDMRSRWMLDRKYLLLILYARLANLRHGR